MRRFRYVLTLLFAVLFAAVGSVAANAGTEATAATVPVLTRSAPGGPPVNPGDVLKSALTPNTALSFTTAPGGPVGLFCKQSTWNGQVLSNPPAPGTAAIKLLNPFTVSACSDNAPTVTGVVSVTVGNLPANFTVSDAAGFPLQILPSPSPLQITAVLTTTGPTVTCVFQAGGPVNGNAGPGPAPWKFVNQPFRLLSGSLPACGTSPGAYLTAQYSPVTDATAGGAQVFVN